MPLKRDPSKALQIGFLALLTISAVQAAYWMLDTVQKTHDDEQRFGQLYRDEADALTKTYAGAPTSEIAALLPFVSIDGNTVHVRDEALAELKDERARRITRILWEGGFFLAVLLGGMAVMTRTIRHDAELRRRQQNFLAAVSHEFKSPLASIQLAAETLVLRSGETDSQRLGRRILEDGERLLRMIDNLLDTTRLEEGRHRPAPAVMSIREAATAAVAEVAERTRANDIDVTLDIADDLRFALDPTALETALRNLLDNAVKACAAGNGHRVVVHAERTPEGFDLTVSDDGLGFPPEDAAMIFEKFYRLGDEQRRSTPGTGLGLYIVRRLVELGGGRVEARSEGPGRGATVTVHWSGHAE
jgi:signal transduction histidine kinase